MEFENEKHSERSVGRAGGRRRDGKSGSASELKTSLKLLRQGMPVYVETQATRRHYVQQERGFGPQLKFLNHLGPSVRVIVPGKVQGSSKQ